MKLSALLGLVLLCSCRHAPSGPEVDLGSTRPWAPPGTSEKAIPGSQSEQGGLLLAPPPASAPAIRPRELPVGAGVPAGEGAAVPTPAPEAELSAPAPTVRAPAPEFAAASAPALSRTEEQRMRDERCAACCTSVGGAWRYGTYSLRGDYPAQYGCCEGADWKPTPACREAARVTAYFGGFGDGREKFRCPAGAAQ